MLYLGFITHNTGFLGLYMLFMQDTWRNCKYSMQMLVSTAEAMRRCWKATDALFASIADWSVQPIDVRHPFCFYYGHLASFAKLKMLPAVCDLVVRNP